LRGDPAFADRLRAFRLRERQTVGAPPPCASLRWLATRPAGATARGPH